MTSLPRRLFAQLGTLRRRLRDRSRLHALVRSLAPQRIGFELIRIGGSGDGGYLVPDDLEHLGACFSPGVDTTATFEADLWKRGIPSYLADASVDGPPSYLGGAHFTKKHLASTSGTGTISLDDWVESTRSTSSSDLILQMDIEGAEYDCLLATSAKTLGRFRIIVVELHRLSALGQQPFFDHVSATLAKVLTLFDVVHLHPNNCCGLHDVNGVRVPEVLEVTLIRKDRGRRRLPVRRLPHPLDRPNVPSLGDIVLPARWLRR